MVGVTWSDPSGASSPRIELRTLGKGGWSDWLILEEEEASGLGRRGTSPAYVGPATGIEVRVTTAPGDPAPTEPRVILIAPIVLDSDLAIGTVGLPKVQARARSFVGTVLTPQGTLQPSIVSRAAWGARAAVGCSGPDATINAVVVHHTEGSNGYTQADSPGIVRGIQSYHIDGRGWCDIGYNFLVDRYGTVFEGRFGGINVPVHGAHAYEWNATTSGISLMGSYMTELPPEVQIQAAVTLVAWKLSSYYRAPYGQLTIGGITADVISGHRQASATDCPGQVFYDYLPTFRQRVATAIGTTPSRIQTRWLALGGGSSSLGQPFAGETGVATGRVTRFAKGAIYANAQGTTYVLSTAINDRYIAAGGPEGKLGFPVAEAVCGLVNNGCSQQFAGGIIWWSSASGAWESYGAPLQRYQAIKGPASVLGYPTTQPYCGDTYCSQGFVNGGLYWTVQTGAWENYGPIRVRYGQAGWQDGALGWPTTAVTCDLPDGGCWQRFQGGLVTAPPRAAVGFLTTGPIMTAYLGERLATGRAGYPASDITCTTSGCAQSFENGTYRSDANGQVTFSPSSSTDIYINAVAGMAQQSQAAHRVPASVSIAQSILETGWGGSTLSVYAHNYFGIKCKATPSPYQLGCVEKASLEYFDPANPVSVVSPFRSYASAADSFVDHGYFLATNTRYAAAFSTTTADDFIRAVAAAGYATDPTYADMIISIMQRYDLYRFDSGAAPIPSRLTGAIGDAHVRSGGDSGPLSYRITIERAGPVDGSTYVAFNKGMVASSAAGTYAIYGAIWDAYRFDGAMRTKLGAVTSDPYVVGGITAQNFANGKAYVVAGTVRFFTGEIPARLLDTRPGMVTIDRQMQGIGAVAAGQVLTVPVAGRAGVPIDAGGVMLNLTVVSPAAAGHLTVFPCGSALPTASSLNYSAGQTVSNSVFVGLGRDGNICVYAQASTHVVMDVTDVTARGGSPVPLVPARLMDTRAGMPTVDHQMEATGTLAAGRLVELPVAGRGGVPTGARAVLLNVTVVSPTGSGHVTVFPCGSAAPTASNVNYAAGQTVPNAVLAGIGSGGKVCVISYATTHLVVDVTGYVPQGGQPTPLVPSRLVDTRPGMTTVDHRLEGTGALAAGQVLQIPVAGRGGVAAGATAVTLNVTVVSPIGPGHVTVFACGGPVPTASNLNYLSGQTVSNGVSVKLGAAGSVCVTSYASTHLVVDVFGYSA